MTYSSAPCKQISLHAPVSALFARSGAIQPSLPDGARGLRTAPVAPALSAPDAAHWAQCCRRVRRVEKSLAASLSESDDSYVESWAAQVASFDLDELPHALRSAGAELPSALRATAFAYRDGAPRTSRFRVPRPQRSAYRPTSIRQILTEDALLEISAWLTFWVDCFARNGDFDMPPHLAADEKDEYLRRWRKMRRPLILGQSYFVPEARGIIWDMRKRNGAGFYEPLDFAATLKTHLDLGYLREFLRRSRDKAMVQQLTECGVTFDATVPLQLVLLPHLISLPPGYRRVDKELHRLNDCGYLELIDHIPFLPNRSIMQGSVARKYEPDRPRRISDAGAWRAYLEDEMGVPFVPLNSAIGAKHVVDDSPYPYDNDSVVTTGHLGVVTPSPSTRPHTKLPPEIKPRLSDVLHDVCVLRYLGRVFDLELVSLTDDFKDFFNQFALAPWEYWKVGFPWVRSADAASRRPCWVFERTLGFGYENASNFAQRVAWAITEEIGLRMDEAETMFTDVSALTPEQQAVVAERKALSASTGRNELRLFSVRHMYTDDPLFLVLVGKRGCTRLQRLLRIWGDFVRSSQFRMAISLKREIGISVNWCGVIIVACLGVCLIPKPKLARAIADLRRIETKDASLRFHDYRSTCALLEYLLPWAGNRRDSLFGWYHVHRVCGEHPDALVAPHISGDVAASALEWIQRLGMRPGIPCTDVFCTTKFVPSDGDVFWYIYVDAALEHDHGGLGGYMHGTGWSLPLEAADRHGTYKLPITVVEYVCLFAALEIHAPRVPLLPSSKLVVASDSLGSVDAVINLSSKSAVMQLVTTAIRANPHFAAVHDRLLFKHVFGAGNVFADAESRGYRQIVNALSSQLRVEYQQLDVPDSVRDLLTLVRARHRLLVDIAGKRTMSESETARGKRFRSNSAGDGPSSGSDSDTAPIRHRARSAPPAPAGYTPSPGVSPPSAFAAQRSRRRSPRLPVHTPSPAVSPPVLSSAKPARAPALPALHGSDQSSPDDPPPIVRSPAEQPAPGSSAVADGKRPARDVAASRPAGNASDLIAAPTLCSNVDALLADTSEWALVPTNPTALRELASKGDEYAANAIPRGTVGVDKAGWRKWERFITENFKRGKAWRLDPLVQTGDVAACRRESTVLSLFYVWVFAAIKPRRRTRKKGKPQSALNVIAAVRRVHRRAGYPMPPCPMLATMLQGMNDEYVRLHGDRRCLLPERKEPLTNAYCAAMLAVPDGTRLACGVVNWASPRWVTFRAFLLACRQTGWRKADALSHGSLAPFDLTRADITWFIRNGTRVARLPADYVLIDGDCLVLAPGGAKNDQDGSEFGTQPIYVPFVPGSPLDVASAVLEMQRLVPCADAPAATPMFSSDGTRPLEPDDADTMFRALAIAALGVEVASTLSLHSCRVQLACALLASGADGPLIQAMARWKSPESVKIYGRLTPQNYAQWLRRAFSATTNSAQVQNLPVCDDDEAHVALPSAVAAIRTTDIEATCDPPTDSETEADDDTVVAPRPRAPAIADTTRITVNERNPKRAGSACFARYEAYKAARTKREFLDLGGTSADFAHDTTKGYVVVLDDGAPSLE